MHRLLPILFCALHLISFTVLRAQELDQLLAPHAETYNAAVAELQKTRKTQVTERETEYVKKLDAAITAATDEATIDMLRKEREGLVKGLLAPGNPHAFPAEVTAARKAFFNGTSKATFDYNAAKKKLDDAYLKTLAGLAKQAKSKTAPPGLAGQIADEKRRVTKGN